MRMSVEKLPAVAQEFLETSIVPAAKGINNLAGYGIGLLGSYTIGAYAKQLPQWLPKLQAVGLVDENKTIDIDQLHAEAVKWFEKVPFDVMGFKPEKEDFDRLRDIMNKYGG